MKTQINTLVKGDHRMNIAGTNSEVRNAIAAAVMAENHDNLHISIKGLDLTLNAHWSCSGKSVYYSLDLTDEQALVLGEDLSIYTYDHVATIIVEGNMNVKVSVSARKSENHQWKERFFHYLKEADVVIL